MKIAKLSAMLMLFGAILAGALAGVNALTSKAIAANEAKAAKAALWDTLSKDIKDFCVMGEDDCVLQFNDTYKKENIIKGEVSTVYVAYNNSNEVIGFVFETETKGYNKGLKMLTGFTKDGVAGWTSLENSETPGLGKSLLASGKFKLNVINNKGIKPSDIKDVAAGSTVTANAVYASIANATLSFDVVKGAIK